MTSPHIPDPTTWTRIYGTAAERDAWVTAVRILADFIESSPHLPLPTSINAQATLPTGDPDNPAVIHFAAKDMGLAWNSVPAGSFVARADIGGQRVTYSVWAAAAAEAATAAQWIPATNTEAEHIMHTTTPGAECAPNCPHGGEFGPYAESEAV